MSQIAKAIAARQTKITQLQREIEALQRAASILGPTAPAAATPKAASKPKAKPTVRAKPTAAAKTAAKAKPAAKPQPKAKQKRHQWTAAEKAAIGKRMKAYWAKRRKARG